MVYEKIKLFIQINMKDDLIPQTTQTFSYVYQRVLRENK